MILAIPTLGLAKDGAYLQTETVEKIEINESLDPDKTSRKGIFFSLIGFGGYEALETKRAAIQAGARLGGGITEDILLYLEATGGFLHQNLLKNLLLSDIQVKGQYYFWEGFYMNFGSGVSFGRVQVTGMLNSETKAGFIISSGAGYEFRVSERFFIAPEARIDYRRLKGVNYLTAEVGGQLGWHF